MATAAVASLTMLLIREQAGHLGDALLARQIRPVETQKSVAALKCASHLAGQLQACRLDSGYKVNYGAACIPRKGVEEGGEKLPVPIEFIVKGKPSSVNSTSAKKDAWKLNVRNEASAELLAKYPASPVPAPYVGELTAKFFFFPHNHQYLDVDNGIKHTLDAMAPPIIANDRSVQRLIAERIYAMPGASVVVPAALAPTLLAAFNHASGAGGGLKTQATAIKIEPYTNDNGAMW